MMAFVDRHYIYFLCCSAVQALSSFWEWYGQWKQIFNLKDQYVEQYAGLTLDYMLGFFFIADES